MLYTIREFCVSINGEEFDPYIIFWKNGTPEPGSVFKVSKDDLALFFTEQWKKQIKQNKDMKIARSLQYLHNYHSLNPFFRGTIYDFSTYQNRTGAIRFVRDYPFYTNIQKGEEWEGVTIGLIEAKRFIDELWDNTSSSKETMDTMATKEVLSWPKSEA